MNRLDTLNPEKLRRICSRCGKAIPHSHKGELCPNCEDELLYQKVKKYIVENDVTEVEVAAHFDIPLSTVHNWINEGYIQYRNQSNS